MNDRSEDWPDLPLAEWSDTLDTLHMWTQLVGKIQLALAPMINHWWGITQRVTPRGLATPTLYHGRVPVRIEFDFVDHRLEVETGSRRSQLVLEPRSVADFHADLMRVLEEAGCGVQIDTMPKEVAAPIPFQRDVTHASYDRAAVGRFHTALLQSNRLFETMRPAFIGKATPSHFFWGSFDLALTRFSGRTAPRHPGGLPNTPDWVTREAYSHEVWSAGWWPGNGPFGLDGPAFYAYMYPLAPGFVHDIGVDGASYYEPTGGYLLPWRAVLDAADPDGLVNAFLTKTYAAAADAGQWERAALERDDEELQQLETRVRTYDRPA